MNSKIIALSALHDNYIWILLHDDQTIWVIDPGEAAPVIQIIEQNQFILAGILLTHHHADHCAGTAQLLSYANSKIPVFASHKSPHRYVTQHLTDHTSFKLGPMSVLPLEIPGHTLDHLAYLINEEHLFCGDTLFSAGCGKIFEGTPEMMYQSLQKIVALKESTHIYCGHEYTLANLKFAHHIEPQNSHVIAKIKQVQQLIEQQQPSLPSILKEEKLINPFLRCAHPDVIQAASKIAGKKLVDEVEVFSVLRNYKNSFR